jgi:hypothetical protein
MYVLQLEELLKNICAHIHNVSILSSNVVKEHYVEMIMIMLRLLKKDYVILSSFNLG